MTFSLWFRAVDGALRTIAGYEAMNMIRKGQIRWLAKGDVAVSQFEIPLPAIAAFFRNARAAGA